MGDIYVILSSTGADWRFSFLLEILDIHEALFYNNFSLPKINLKSLDKVIAA